MRWVEKYIIIYSILRTSEMILTSTQTLLEKIQCIYTDWQENSDPEVFYSNFHNEIVCKSQIYFDIDYPLAGIATTKLCYIVFCFLNKRGKSSLTPKTITEVEKDGMQYLAGYVIQKLIKMPRDQKAHHCWTYWDILWRQLITARKN